MTILLYLYNIIENYYGVHNLFKFFRIELVEIADKMKRKILCFNSDRVVHSTFKLKRSFF